jgi:hypothetical protein
MTIFSTPRPLFDGIMFLTACDVDFILKCEYIRWKYVECLPVETESTPWDETQHTQRVPHIIMCTQKKTLNS